MIFIKPGCDNVYHGLKNRLIKTSATVSCLYKVTLRDTTSVAELNIFRESVTNHNAKLAKKQ